MAAADSAIGASAASDPSTAGVLVDSPAPLPSTGGAINWGVIAIGLLLLAGGGLVVLAVARRGREQE